MRALTVLIFLVLTVVLVVEGKKIKRRIVRVVQERVAPPPQPKFRPGVLYNKPLTEYDKCKLECRRVKDRVEMEEYVQHLKDELAAVESKVADASQNSVADSSQESSAIQEVPSQPAAQEVPRDTPPQEPSEEDQETEESRLARMANAAKRMVSNAVHKVKGEKQETGV